MVPVRLIRKQIRQRINHVSIVKHYEGDSDYLDRYLSELITEYKKVDEYIKETKNIS